MMSGAGRSGVAGGLAALFGLWGMASCGQLLDPLLIDEESTSTSGSTGSEVTSTGLTLDGTTTTTSMTTSDTGSTSSSTRGSTSTGDDPDTSGSSSTGVDRGLLDDGVLVRYFIDERKVLNPMLVLDAVEPPLNLLIHKDDLDVQPYRIDDGGNLGLAWDNPGGGGRVRETVTQKVIDGLDDSAVLTIELVASLDDASAGGGSDVVRLLEVSDVVSVGASVIAGFIVIMNTSLGTFTMQWNRADVESLGRSVYHVVIDTTDGNGGQRVTLYVNGASLGPPGNQIPAQDALFDVDDAKELVLGNGLFDDLSFGGTLYYAALYDVALSLDEVQAHTELLVADDDTQP